MRAPALLLAAALLGACTAEPRLRIADTTAGDTAGFDATGDSAVEAAMAPVWKAAADSGYTFRAIGQEPGWLLTIHRQRGIHYVGSYGDEKLDAPPTEPVSDARGTLTYLAPTSAGTLAITIEPKPCADAMSGARMTHTVSVTLSGRTVHGCGNALRATPSGAPRRIAP